MGDVDGTTLGQTALWSATAVDNTFNVLQGVVLEQINGFFGPKCDEALKKGAGSGMRCFGIPPSSPSA